MIWHTFHGLETALITEALLTLLFASNVIQRVCENKVHGDNWSILFHDVVMTEFIAEMLLVEYEAYWLMSFPLTRA